jgi:hypothetical protein
MTRKNMATMNLNVKLIRNVKKESNRFIDAVRFLCHLIPGDLVGPGPASAADLAEFAPSAFSLVPVRIPKTLKYRGMGPDLPERDFPDLSAIEFQVTAGLNLAPMGDKTE